MNARRFGRLVSASVSASSRARRSIRRLSRKESDIRADGQRDRGGGEHDAERVDRVDLVVDEDPERDQRERGREDEHARERHAAAQARAERPPGGVGEQQHRRRPQRREQRVARVGAERDLARVQDVGDRLHRERDREQRPAEPGPPAGQREQRGDEREQAEVEQRIGEVGRGLPAVAGGVGEHRVERDGRRQRRDRGGADGGVEPHRGVERAPQPRAQHEHDAGADREVRAEPERVGDRRVRARAPAPRSRRSRR